MDFNEWKVKFDIICINKTGVTSEDLPDWDFWSAWDSGISPKEAFEEFITEIQDCF